MTRGGIVVGMAMEAALLRRSGLRVAAGGGLPAGAAEAARRLIAEGASLLVSFGLAGGLDPDLRPGVLIAPRAVQTGGRVLAVDTESLARMADAVPGVLTVPRIAATETAITTAADKARLFAETGAAAVDLESGAVALAAEAAGLPFIVLRAICDDATNTLPSAALVALRPDGGVSYPRLIADLLRHPAQLPALLKLGQDAKRGRQALARGALGLHWLA